MEHTPQITSQVLAELQRATAKFPTWPTDPLHALAVLGEEYGELNKAMLQHTYEPHKPGGTLDAVREEAIQTAAMALRLAEDAAMFAHAVSLGQRYKQRAEHAEAELDALKARIGK